MINDSHIQETFLVMKMETFTCLECIFSYSVINVVINVVIRIFGKTNPCSTKGTAAFKGRIIPTLL